MSVPNLHKVALLLAEDDPYSAWYAEAMVQSGLVHEKVGYGVLDHLDAQRTLALCGHGTLTDKQKENLKGWVSLGGSLVCSGGTWGLEELLGLQPCDEPRYSRQTVKPALSDRLWPEKTPFCRSLGGQPVKDGAAQVIARCSSGNPAVTRHGRTWFLAPHLGQTLALMCMGRSVEGDAIGPGDGSALLEDGIFRAEDGSHLSFADDRHQAAAGPSFFAFAHADILAEVWVRCLVEAVERTGSAPMLLWHWPNNLDAVASCTIDCDDLQPELAQKINNQLAKFGIRASWLVQTPGYAQDVYKGLRNFGQHVGLLFGGQNDTFTEDQLKVQQLTIGRAAGLSSTACVRPGDGRWEGLARFYEMAEAAGSKISVSKGGRQAGTSGFLFGTSRPFQPHRKDGRAYRALELPYSIFCPGDGTCDSSTPIIVDEVIRRNGCLHFAYATSWASRPGFEKSSQNLHMLMRQSRLTTMSPEDIAAYESGRRSVRVGLGALGSATLVAEQAVTGLTVLVGAQGIEGRTIKGKLECRSVVRYGTRFSVFVMDLEHRAQQMLKFEAAKAAA